jgi:hypothetical protein
VAFLTGTYLQLLGAIDSAQLLVIEHDALTLKHDIDSPPAEARTLCGDRAHSFGNARVVNATDAVLKRASRTSRKSAGRSLAQSFGHQSLHRVFPL